MADEDLEDREEPRISREEPLPAEQPNRNLEIALTLVGVGLGVASEVYGRYVMPESFGRYFTLFLGAGLVLIGTRHVWQKWFAAIPSREVSGEPKYMSMSKAIELVYKKLPYIKTDEGWMFFFNELGPLRCTVKERDRRYARLAFYVRDDGLEDYSVKGVPDWHRERYNTLIIRVDLADESLDDWTFARVLIPDDLPTSKEPSFVQRIELGGEEMGQDYLGGRGQYNPMAYPRTTRRTRSRYDRWNSSRNRYPTYNQGVTPR